jgi:hypothetical protein
VRTDDTRTATTPTTPDRPLARGSSAASDRTTARLVGGFYVLATAAGIASTVVGQPVPAAADLVAVAHPDDGRLVTGALLEMLMGVAVAAVALSIHPVLRRFHERLAHTYVVARTVEGAAFVLGAVGLLTAIELSRTAAGGADTGVTGPLGSYLRTQRELTGQVMGVGAFTVSAFVLYAVLYRTRLVPRWLSVWGLVSAVPFAVPVLTTAYGIDLTPATEVLLNAPLGLQEMVLAGWLIVRGFDATARPVTRPGAPAGP